MTDNLPNIDVSAPSGALAWTRGIALAILLLALGGRTHAQIVAFGASNISGWNVAASEAIPAQLQMMLREKGYGIRVFNKGIYGNTSADMRARMDADIPDGIQIVVLDTSGPLYDDSLKGVGRDQSEANLDAIKARLAERNIKIVPLSTADIPPQYRQQDGRHLTPEGHRLAAAGLVPEITQILGPPPPITQAVRDACRADARRLCSAVIFDESKRRQCMQEHREDLSQECLSAIAASRRPTP